jgi:multidrug efflux pump subunit AcrA (membrane-fusion protein)
MRHLGSALLFCGAALVGCDPKQSKSDSDTAAISLFKEGKGVWFSDETKKLFGLEVAEVTEKSLRLHLEKTAQVYRRSSDQSAAVTVLLLPEESKELEIGQTVRLSIAPDACEFSGRLTRLDEINRATFGQIEALIDFADPQGRCKVGTFLKASFTGDEARVAFVVPESAVLRAADGAYVYVVNGTHLTRTRVKTGVVSEGLVEIRDGLYAGDLVVIKGLDGLWIVELSALKGGTPCCPVPKK